MKAGFTASLLCLAQALFVLKVLVVPDCDGFGVLSAWMKYCKLPRYYID